MTGRFDDQEDPGTSSYDARWIFKESFAIMFLLIKCIAKRCAPTLFMVFLLIGLLIGMPRPRASAQGESTSSIRMFAHAPVPIARKYVPWASNSSRDSAGSFSLTPRTTHIMMAVIVGTILLANIRLPRKPSY